MSNFDVAVFTTLTSDRIRMDAVRSRLVGWIGKELEALLCGKRFNRFRKLLLGSEGAGKTRLLKGVLHAASWASDGRVVPCYIDYSAPETARLPSAHLWDALPLIAKLVWPYYRMMYPNEDASALICRAAEARGYVMFLAVDEFQCVYGSRCPLGQGIVGEMSAIGGIEGRIHCIITGDSTILQELVFCSLGDELRAQYPNYCPALTLNNTKFGPAWIS